MKTPMSMRYVKRVLQPNEAIFYTAQLHWRIYIRCVFLLVIAIILAFLAMTLTGPQPGFSLALWIGAGMFLLLALAAGLRAFVRRATTELAITDHRIIYKTGLLRRHTLEMNRGKVESVDVDQTILGRILGYGTIIVRGTGGSLEPIRDVTAPLTFRTHITTAA